MRTSGQIARTFYEHLELTERQFALILADKSLDSAERANRLNAVRAVGDARNLELQTAYQRAIEAQGARIPSRPLTPSRRPRGRFGRRRNARPLPAWLDPCTVARQSRA
jgi:hypothetical protein